VPAFSRRRLIPLLSLLAGVRLIPVMGAPRAAAAQPAPSTPRITALVAATTNAPLRVRGDDGLEHLEYDLVITNVFAAPVTLIAIEVTAPDGRVLLRLEGDALAAETRPIFGGPPTSAIPVSGVVGTVMDVTVAPGEVPARLGHRIAYDLPPDAPARAVIASLVADGPEIAVDARAPIVIAPPLRGAGWLNGSGCCRAGAQHRVVRLAADGTYYLKPETFAIDWVRLQDGRLFAGDGARVEQWYGFGAEVLSAADGVVVSVRDGMPEERPNQPPLAVRATEDYAGNNVVVQIGPGVWAVYGHLQPGSLRVRAGDRVAAGQVLGLLGNTGNSSGPHLHFGLQGGPDFLASNSLPFVFDRYTLTGAITEEDLDAVAEPDGHAASIEGPGGPQSRTYQLYLSVADFP
jgi:hypothetical protein